MNRFGPALAALALVATAGRASAAEWNRTFPISGHARVVVETNDGSVVVRGEDRHDVAVHIETRGMNLERNVIIEAGDQGGVVTVSAKLRPRLFFFDWTNRALRIEVLVPRQLDLDVRSSDGGLNVESVSGHAVLTTSDGPINAHVVKGDISLHTSDGSIVCEEFDGTLSASTSDGPIRVSGRFDHLDLRTSDGRIRAAALAGSTIGDGWNLHTSDGSVTLELPATFRADLDASSGDGAISVDFPVTVSGEWGRHHLRGTMNGGGGTLVLHTGDGAIRVVKS